MGSYIGIMRRLVPDFILERAARGSAGGVLTAPVLFVDVVGFSEITGNLAQHGQHGAEVVAALMRRTFEPLIEEVQGHGGFVAGFAGDALTAVFPADDDAVALHAAAAALGIQAVSGLTGDTPYGAFTIEMRVGAAIGEVIWGIVADGAERATYFVHGRAVDEAATAQTWAAPGETMVTRPLATALGAADTEPNGDHLRLISVPGTHPGTITPPLERGPIGLTRRFVPPDVLSSSGAGEFRHVVSVFVSVSTSRAEAQLQALMQTVFALQDRFGGFFSRLDFGDKGAVLILFWGAPVAHENDVMQALEFALAFRAETDVPISAGITYGIAHAGFIGSERRAEYTCYGPATNLAARFMTVAPRGEIWIDEDVARRAGDYFDTKPTGEHVVKGFDRPLAAWALEARRHAEQARDRAELVGREREVAALMDFVAPMLSGQFVGAALVSGEAGVGKSRLVGELIDRLARGETGEQRCSVFVGQTDETYRDSLNPFRHWLRRYFGPFEHRSAGHDRRSFAATLDELIAATEDSALAAELDRTRSFLGALVGVSWPGSLFEELTGEARRENTFIGLAALLEAEARRRPVLLVLEDVHWLDDDTRAFIPELLRSVSLAGVPLALVTTARPDVHDPEGVWAPGLVLSLEDLTRDEVGRLVAVQLGGPPSPALVDLLVERAEGNPFFVEELSRYLRDEGLIRRDERGWSPMATDGHPVLPVDVRAALVARFDRQDPQVRVVVQAASVLGREFDAALLGPMLDDVDGEVAIDVDEAVQAAVRSDFWARAADRRFEFRHALVREAAYEMQAMTRRRDLHERAVRALESAHGNDDLPPYAELGHHAERAGMTGPARRYLRLAGEAAAARFSNQQAIEHLTRALALTPADDAEARVGLLLGRASACHQLGRRELQSDDLDELDRLTERSDDAGLRIDVRLQQSDYARAVGDYDAAISAATDAIELSAAHGDVRREAAAHAAIGRFEWDPLPPDLVRRHLGAALDLAAQHGLYSIEADAHLGLGVAAADRDRWDQALHHYERGLERARQAGDRHLEASALNSFGLLRTALHDHEAARACLMEALAIRRDLGYRLGEASTLTNLAIVADVQGRHDDAVRGHREALEIAVEIGDGYNEAWARNNLAFLEASVGQFDLAAEFYDEALQIGRTLRNRRIEGNVLSNMSLLAHQRGDDDRALQLARRVVRIALDSEARELLAEARTNEGHALTSLGQLDAAHAAYREALEIRVDLGQDPQPVETIAGLARVDLAHGHAAQAAARIEPIVERLSAGDLGGAFEPIRVYVTSIAALEAIEDRRARDLEATAGELLMRRAAHIADPDTRRSFLGSVRANRELLERRR